MLIKLLNVVNERLRANGSTEKITLIGPSMGGLISRYALRYMELQGMNANCKLWISFDSPHNGANIPIGGQQFLDFFGNQLGQVSAKQALNQNFDNPAAKQMLIHHYRNGETVGGAPGFRDRFVSTMNSLGYPQAACLQKVALVNGSKNGTPQPFGACQEALNLNARLTDLSTGLCFAAGIFGGIFAPIIGGACAVGRDGILSAKVYSAPSGSDRCLTMRKTITNFNFGVAERYASGRGSNQPSMDTQPGGYYNVLGEIADKAREKNWFYRVEVNTLFTPGSAFIPTVSSYGLYNTDRNWGASLNGINVTTETPFAAIQAPDINEPHTQLTQAGVTFARQQIAEANRQQCSQPPVGGGGPLTPGCYVIKVQKTGQSLQAMPDGSIKQQNGNNQNNQIWKAEDVGGNQFRFITQNGSGQVAKVNNGSNVGEQLSLGSYTGDDRQKWAAQQNGNSGNFRIYRSNGLTWDLNNYGINPELQLYGTTSEPFYDYRSFRFESVTCPSGGGSSCDFTITANTVNAGCGGQVQLTASCSGANCDGITYTWSGNGLSQTGQNVTFNAPGSNGSFTYTVTASRNGCGNKTATANVNVSGCGGGTGGGTPTVGSCYVIKVQKTGKSLEAMSDGSIKQLDNNGQNSQIWKAEDAGGGQFRFTTQNGSGQVAKVNDGNNSGEQLSLGGYTGDDRQKWSIQQNGTSGNFRIYRSGNGITWDLNNYGINPELQLWGTISEPFQDYRSFRFESATCPGGGNTNPGGGFAFGTPQFTCSSGQLILSTTGGNGTTVEYSAPGLQGWSTNNVFTIPTWQRNGTTFTFYARQSGTQIQLSYTTSCPGYRLAAPGAVTEGPDTDALVVAPNPSKGTVTVRFRLANEQKAQLSVVNLSGRTLHKQTVVGMGGEQTERIDMEGEAAGLYLIQLQTPQGMRVGKVVLER